VLFICFRPVGIIARYLYSASIRKLTVCIFSITQPCGFFRFVSDFWNGFCKVSNKYRLKKRTSFFARLPITITMEPWFHRNCSREDAELLLKSQENGSYLVRRSRTCGTWLLVLSIKYYELIQHVLFGLSSHRALIVVEEDIYCFRTVQHMLDYFKVYPLYFLDDKRPIQLTQFVFCREPIYV